MEARAVVHPSTDTLQAYALGKLDDGAARLLSNHLLSCPVCREQAAAMDADSFLNRLRDAHNLSGTPAPAKSLSPLPQSRAAADPASGTPLRVPGLPPELVNHPQYEIVRELGRGGMGVVYLARNKLLGRHEVLKVVNKAILEEPGVAERFLREIQSAALLNHPNVVTAYSALLLGGGLAFAMEYVDGQDLARLVKAQGPLPVAYACYCAREAALGLQHAHERKMVHRDIKPQNLILARDGAKHLVKVLDFGLAKVFREKGEDHGLTGTGMMMGTPDYIAPEQSVDAANADIRADIYSLGCTLYYLLTGAAPFMGRSLYEILQAHHSTDAKALNLVRPEVPAELAAVVQKMMAKSPEQRYQTPGEVAGALAPFIKRKLNGPPAGASQLVDRQAAAAWAVPPSPPKAGDSMKDFGSTSVKLRTARAARHSPPAKPTTSKKWLIGGAGVVVGLLVLIALVGVVGLWAAGVFKVKTKDGTIVLEHLPPDADVTVDGGTVTVKSSDGKTVEVRVAPGKKHRLEVKKDGFKTFGEEVEIDAGGRKPILVRLEPIPPDKPAVGDKEKWVSLFNGKGLTGWTALDGKPAQWESRDGFVEVKPGTGDIMTKEKFGPDFKLHAEFWLPLMPNEKGQGRANSGIFLQGRYEVQILDSFMNDTFADGSIGALFGLIAPDADALQEAIRPPEQWQTYDITFHAPRVDAQGKVTVKGRITVVLNGVTVINEGQFYKTSPSATDDSLGAPGPIRLQDHGAKVRFRNIEIKELPDPKQ